MTSTVLATSDTGTRLCVNRGSRNVIQSILLTLTICFILTLSAKAQDTCPQGQVCLPQATANKLLSTVEQLIAAKDTIAKLLNERGQSDAVIASANRVIEDYKQLDAINGMIVAKQKLVIDLYEKTLTMYASLVEKMEVQMNKGKTGWQKFTAVLGKIAVLLAGVLIGRGAI